MELDFFTFENIDEYNKFVKSEKRKGRIVIPVTVMRYKWDDKQLTIYFYYKGR